jgi:methionyl-tRNA synthetase
METIPYSEWEKIDLRVGKILSVEDHPNADKLYLVEVDLGKLGKKKLVAGLKKAYTPKQLIGKLCTVFTNLQPAEIRGIKSDGMILAAVDENDKSQIIAPKKMEPGSKVR